MKDEIFNRYLGIKQDLVNNLQDVFMRSHYYTHKYRGNILTDLNVALSEDNNGIKTIRIFIRHKGLWIRDVLTYNSKGLINNKITSNFLYNE